MMTSPDKRSGRRPGSTATREAILLAAREAFTDSGYRGATIRAIAVAAGVDPALVMHFFGNKEALFAEAMRPPFEPAAVLAAAMAADPANAGAVVATFFLDAWDSDSRRSLLGLVRSAVTEESAAAMVRDGLVGGVETALASLGTDRPGMRASLIATQLIGLAIGRYIVRLQPLVDAPRNELVAAVAPALQRYISGDLTKGEGS
ncbi:MAG: TetR family transcriptional regulator [bacterium]